MILWEDAKDCPDVSRDTALVIWALGLGGGDEECRLCGGVGRAYLILISSLDFLILYFVARPLEIITELQMAHVYSQVK